MVIPANAGIQEPYIQLQAALVPEPCKTVETWEALVAADTPEQLQADRAAWLELHAGMSAGERK